MGDTLQVLAIAIPTGGVAVLAYLVVGLVIGVESMGIPLPGETTLIAAALLASRGDLDLVLVIGAAALGAVVGDSIGYLIGRKAGPGLFQRLGARFHHFSDERIARAERYFGKYGVWTVFFGRFVALLRIFAGPMAGSLRMPYSRFLGANAAGGIAWSATIGIVAYNVGDNADRIFSRLSVWGLAAVAVLLVAAYGYLRLRRRAAAATAAVPEAALTESALTQSALTESALTQSALSQAGPEPESAPQEAGPSAAEPSPPADSTLKSS